MQTKSEHLRAAAPASAAFTGIAASEAELIALAGAFGDLRSQEISRDAGATYIRRGRFSDDDLGVVVTRTTARLGRNRLRRDDALVRSVLQLICTLADDDRFPWLRQDRAPRVWSAGGEYASRLPVRTRLRPCRHAK